MLMPSMMTSLILNAPWSVMSRQSTLMGGSPPGRTISVETIVPLSSVRLPRILNVSPLKSERRVPYTNRT